MGIRLQKAIGYGLTDVVVDEGCQLTDPRINADSCLLTTIPTPGRPSYVEWLKRQLTGDEMTDINLLMELGMLESVDPRDVYSTVVHHSEYAMPNVLLVRPVGSRNWHRREDPIDCQEEMLLPIAQADNRVARAVGNLYPYDGLYMDVRTGEQLRGKQSDHVIYWRRVVNALREDTEDRTAELDTFAKLFGCETHAEAERCIVPLVPREVRNVCEWGELFTSPDIWLQLRPLVYAYYA